MALLHQPVQVAAQLGKVFKALRDGQAPETFNRSFLNDLGFKSSNFFAVIPLLKGLGFLSAEGKPTSRYLGFLDETRWQDILGTALREAYSDIFVMKAKPTSADKKQIVGKFKSTFNLTDKSAERDASTFLALLELAGDAAFQTKSPAAEHAIVIEELKKATPEPEVRLPPLSAVPSPSGGLALHYNIQIHLPPTKDIEVYNAIFKSLRSHLID